MSTRYILRNEEELSAISYQLSARQAANGRQLRRAYALAAIMLALTNLGCSEAEKRKWKPISAERNYVTALDSKNGDLRRDAVVRIGESRYFDSADAFHVLDAVARTDPVSQVRCIAIRTLARYKDGRPVKTLMTILTAAGPNGEAVVPGEDVRWEAAEALTVMQSKSFIDAAGQTAACESYIQLLRSDRSRNVRLTSTRALGLFKDRRVLMPLFQTLRNQDFMIADTAERSLMTLTGTTHDYDADAWTKWLENNPDPFLHAGEPVVTTRPAGPTWWDQQRRSWRRALKLNGTE